jgi:hypothetical protein
MISLAIQLSKAHTVNNYVKQNSESLAHVVTNTLWTVDKINVDGLLMQLKLCLEAILTPGISLILPQGTSTLNQRTIS